jgi:predicted metal-binding protein
MSIVALTRLQYALLVAYGALVVSLVACATRDKPPCDPSTVAEITARCILEVRRCPRDLNQSCPAEEACFRELDERQARCLK